MYTGRLVTISFFGMVAANSKKTLVSKRLNVPFATRIVRCSFPPGVNRLMKLYFFVSPDEVAPTTKEPTGYNILAQTGQAVYITGDNESKKFPMEIEEFTKGRYVKVYAVNEDTYEHTIDVQITIEFLYLLPEAAPEL